MLRERAREVGVEELRSAEVQRLIDDLIETKRAANGAGIAANQVGETLRIAVVEVEPGNPRYPYKPRDPADRDRQPGARAGRRRAVEIIEGCLSVPDLRGAVPRYEAVRVRYLDRDGEPHEEVRRGLTAGTFQHEVDHLDGVLFLDRVQRPDDVLDLGAVRRTPGGVRRPRPRDRGAGSAT